MLPADLFRLITASDARIMPDGARIAFVVTRLDEEQDQYLSNIWVADSEGGAPRRFTTGPKRDTSPRWSPDGKWLAFVSEREEKKKAQVYVMPVAGGEPRRLTDLKGGCGELVWSPDSARLAFTSRLLPSEPEANDQEKSKPARYRPNRRR